MKIAVCIKVVPSNTFDLRLDPASRRLVRTGSGVIGPSDRHAVEAALRIAEAGSDVEIVVVSVSRASELGAVRDALAMGAHRAILIADPAFEGSDLLPTSRALAAALAGEAPDLVLFGPQGDDSGGAMLWAAVADRLRLPVLSQAEELTVDDGTATVKRQAETGYEVIRAALPCVVGVAGSINQPRFASVKGKITAKNKPVDLRNAAKLELALDAIGEAGSGTVVLALGDPPQRARATVIKADDDVAEQIYAFLAERKLVA
jgi:electron transfer flavoprotein beta subunit